MSEAKQIYLQLLNYKAQEFRLEKAWKRFKSAGFKPLLIKGWAAAQNYPNPSNRTFNDIDLIVSGAEYIDAVGYLESVGKNLGVDLHKNAKNLDTLSFEELYARSRILKCGETDVRVLSAEDHLRILVVHWLIDGGAKKEKLWDIYYAVENRPESFDWNRCLNAAGKIRRKWIVCAIGLAHRYLKLSIDDTPVVTEAKDIPYWIIEALEKEWQSTVKIRPLIYCYRDTNLLWQQIKKRLPPNPIQATVQMEGRFDESSRIKYQIGNIFQRFLESTKSLVK